MSGRTQPMTATHTPTPWSYKRAGFPIDGEYDCGISAVIDGKPYCIGEAVGRCSTDIRLPAEANAAFIVEAVNSHEALKARIQDLEAALQVAQELFAIVVNPQDHPNTSVQHLWAQCKEIECKIRDLLKDGAVLVPVRDDGAGRIKELEDALRKISCPHVTDRPLWWQLEARTALLANDLRDALQHIQPKDGAK